MKINERANVCFANEGFLPKCDRFQNSIPTAPFPANLIISLQLHRHSSIFAEERTILLFELPSGWNSRRSLSRMDPAIIQRHVFRDSGRDSPHAVDVRICVERNRSRGIHPQTILTRGPGTHLVGTERETALAANRACSLLILCRRRHSMRLRESAAVSYPWENAHLVLIHAYTQCGIKERWVP